jgi:hypothetical protein
MKILNKILKKFRPDPRVKFNEKVRREMYREDEAFLGLNLSNKAFLWHKYLRLNGIVKIENEFLWVQQIYKENYFNTKVNHFFLEDLINERAEKTGRTYCKAVSLGDPLLYNWYFNHDLISLLGKMYRQQPFYRNQPIVQTYSYSDKHSEDIAGKWHIDGGLNQITFMLLINDITEDDTHMQFALKSSHKNHKTLKRSEMSGKEIESEFEIMKCIGKAGTLYVFQGGMGFHRAVYKKSSTRSVYHVNFTPGHDIQNDGLQKKNDMPDLVKEPFFVKNCADLILN